MKTSKNRDDIALEPGQQIAATVVDEAIVYFAIDEHLTDYEVSLAAFEVRHNRQPTTEELTLLAMMERNKTDA